MLRIVASRQPARAHDALQVALEQGDAGAFDGDVGAGAHGDADIGRGEGGRIVDAVTGHGDDAALALQPLDDRALLIGQHLGLDLGDAEAARDRLGRRAVVAGQHDDADAVGAQGFERRWRRRLDRIGDGDDAGGLAVDADEDRGGAVAAQLLRLGRERARVDAQLRQERALPSTTRLPSTMPMTPLPVGESKSAAAAERDLALLRRPRRWPRASGCSLARSTLAASRSKLVSSKPSAATTAVTAGLPSVSVPVLSTTSVSTFSSRSSASAFLMSTPAWAPRPTPTMIDIGVARPSAHGQAMMSTATAATSP